MGFKSFWSREILSLSAVAAWTAGTLILFGLHAFPLVEVDAGAYLLPAVNVAAGRGLVNQVREAAFNVDPTGHRRFLNYPPLFQLVVSHLMWKPTGQNALLVVSLLNALSIFLCAWVFVKILELRQSPAGGLDILFASVCLLGMGSLFCYFNEGRPETLAYLQLLLGTIAVFYTARDRLWLVLGVLNGLMLATHQLRGAMIFCVIGLWMTAVYPPRAALKHLIGCGVLAALVFVLILQISPFGLIATLQGTLKHGRAVAFTPPVLQMGWRYFAGEYLACSSAPFFGALLLLSLAIGISMAVARRRGIASPVLFFLFLIVFVFFIHHFSFRSHNLTLLAPLLYGLLIYDFLHTSSGAHKIVSACVVAATAVGLVRCSLLFPYYLKDGMTLDQARQELRTIESSFPGRLDSRRVTYSLWVLSEDYDRMSFFDLNHPEDYPASQVKNSLVLIQQNYLPFSAPPEAMPGYRLEHSWFVNGVPALFGIPLAHKMPGYGFALYLPKTEEKT